MKLDFGNNFEQQDWEEYNKFEDKTWWIGAHLSWIFNNSRLNLFRAKTNR